MPEAKGEVPGATRFATAALLLGASVMLSRVIGYAREAVLASQLGTGAAMDAYRAAFQLPDYLNYFLAGGALSIAFIPLYSRALEGRGQEAAERLFATVLGTTGVAAAVATALLWWWAEPLTALQFGGEEGFGPETVALTAHLTRIVLPAQVFFVTGGVVRAVLMAHGRFGAQAAAPLLYNGGIIAGGLLFPERGPEGFAWGALAGALVGGLLYAAADAARVVRVRLRVAPLDREFLGYMAVAAPLMLGLSLLTVDEWYERIFGSRLGEGVVASLGYARQLMLAPVAVVGQAVATAALPTLARLYSQRRAGELARTLLRTLQASLGLALLCGAGVFAVAPALVAVLFQHGAFTAEDTERVALLLRVLCFAVPGWVVQQVAVRAFFARGDTWRPMALGTGLVVLALPLYWALARSHGAVGLAAAGALGVSANALATLAWARRLHGAPALVPLARTGARGLAAALPAGAVALLWPPAAPGTTGALVALLGGGALFAAVALPLAWLLGDEALRDGVARLRAPLRRLLRRPPPRSGPPGEERERP